LILAQI